MINFVHLYKPQALTTTDLEALEIDLTELSTRRRFIIGAGGLIGAAALGACGVGEEAAAPTATTGATRTVETVFGTVTLPANPQRAIAFYPSEMDFALVLGIPLVVGTGALGSAQASFLQYQQERYPEALERTEKVQGRPEPDLERTAALNPDVILVYDFTDEETYALYSEIAPTLAIPFFSETEINGVVVNTVSWRRSLQFAAEALGRQQEADEFLANYDTLVENLRPRLSERWSGATFARIQPQPEGFFVSGYANSVEGQILFEELKLTPAPFVMPDTQQVSLELIPQLEEADVLLISREFEADKATQERDLEELAAITDSELWQRLPAVQNDQVFEFDKSLTVGSPLGAVVFVDYLEQTLLG